MLNALQETETALSTYARALDRRRSLLSARNFAEQAAMVARAQQKEGAIDGLQLLDTERTFSRGRGRARPAGRPGQRGADRPVPVRWAVAGRRADTQPTGDI